MDDKELADMLDDLDDQKPKLSIVPVSRAEAASAVDPEVLLPELVDRFISKFDTMSNRESEDREKLRDVINFLEGIVFNTKDPKRAHLEQLVGAYRVLMDSNANQTRALDALSKLLTAGKGTQVMINNSNSQPQSEQDELLALLEGEEELGGQ